MAHTVKPQLAFEPQARPELEATVARLAIDFESHVRPTATMLWSRIAKARILDIARTVFGISWTSARSKTKKAALAETMETAFAAGDVPVGLSVGMHAAAFDTWRIGDEPDTAAQAEASSAADADEVESAATQEPAEPAEGSGAEPPDALDAGNGNGHAAPESEAADGGTGTAGHLRSSTLV